MMFKAWTSRALAWLMSLIVGFVILGVSRDAPLTALMLTVVVVGTELLIAARGRAERRARLERDRRWWSDEADLQHRAWLDGDDEIAIFGRYQGSVTHASSSAAIHALNCRQADEARAKKEAERAEKRAAAHEREVRFTVEKRARDDVRRWQEASAAEAAARRTADSAVQSTAGQHIAEAYAAVERQRREAGGRQPCATPDPPTRASDMVQPLLDKIALGQSIEQYEIWDAAIQLVNEVPTQAQRTQGLSLLRRLALMQEINQREGVST